MDLRVEPSKLRRTRLSQIVSAIDGDDVYRGCGLGLKTCNANKPCPAHDRFIVIREELKEMLESTSVEDLTYGLKDGQTFLKRQDSLKVDQTLLSH